VTKVAEWPVLETHPFCRVLTPEKGRDSLLSGVLPEKPVFSVWGDVTVTGVTIVTDKKRNSPFPVSLFLKIWFFSFLRAAGHER